MQQSGRNSELFFSGDATLESFVQGEGPMLVVLPSFGRDGAADFDDFAAILAASGFRVVRPQPRGTGGSVGSMQASLQDMADDVAHVVRALGRARAAVLGHAFGNGVARLLAASHGDLVAGTILAAASTAGASHDINETPFIAGDPSRSEQERLDALTRAFFAPRHDPRPWLHGWYPETLRMQRAAVRAATPEAFSGAGSAPILQIIAESDPFSPYPTWRDMREQCGSRVTARIVADASHALFPEQTPVVAGIVGAWISPQATALLRSASGFTTRAWVTFPAC